MSRPGEDDEGGARDPDPERLGTVIDARYVVEAVIGRGNMGVVVAARHVTLGEPVALKFLKKGAGGPERAERMRREARVSVRLKSEHVAKVKDVGVLASGAPYIVMERLVGEDLSKLLRRAGRLSIAEASDVILQACEAMAEAHALGVVHRDLKPSNLFVTRDHAGDPFIKVLDFGVAKAAEVGLNDVALTQSTSTLGTPLYMAPEQIWSPRDVDSRADVWALGVLLYECLTGSSPFDAASIADVYASIARGTPHRLATLRGDVPLALDRAVHACLERDRAQRVPDVASLAAALRPFAPIHAARTVVAQAASAASPGSILDGKYELKKKLGEGGMGAVYEGRHLVTGRRVAVKVISPAVLDKGKGIVDRFHREARATGLTETEHIVQVLDSGTDAQTGAPYMAMEFLRGEDVAALLERLGPLAPDVALRIAYQACVGLAKAHEAGIVHRDIKPGNLFLARRDDGVVIVKLLDFGVAKLRADELSAENAKLTRTGSVLGSPLYMSPEQAKGSKATDHRSDLWSLGVVLYELCSASTPHGGCETIGELIFAICGEPAPPLQDRAPSIEARVAAVVHRALAIDASHRFASAREMLEELRALLPNGAALTEDVLVPAVPALQARTAPRLTPATLADGSTRVRMSSAPASAPPRHASRDPSLSVTPQPLTRLTSPGKPAGARLAIGLVAAASIAAIGYGVTSSKRPTASTGNPIVTADPGQSAAPGAPLEPATGSSSAASHAPTPISTATTGPSAPPPREPLPRTPPTARSATSARVVPPAPPVESSPPKATVAPAVPPPPAKAPSPIATSTDEFGDKR